MARPKNSRRVERAPGATFFTPCGVPLTEAETVTLTVEGLEALRLSDLEGLNASDAAGRCGVSRHAYGRTLAEARRTVAEALVKGRILRIEGGKVTVIKNDAGGINGGVSNGNAITLGVSVRPTPSIAMKQQSVDLVKKENVEISIKGRHDACIVPRAVPVVEAAVAIALADALLEEEK